MTGFPPCLTARPQEPVDIFIAVSLPPPPVSQVPDLSRLTDVAEGREGLCKHDALLGALKRLSKRMAEGPAKENGPRRLHLYRIIPYDGYPDRGNPCPLYLPPDQSHGLVADASAGRKQDGVDRVMLQAAGDLGRRRVHEREDMLSGDVAHEPVVPDS